MNSTMNNTLDTTDNTTTFDFAAWVPAPRAPLAGVAANPDFNAALEALEDAIGDQMQYGNALPGTPEDALMAEADARYATARNDLFAVVNSLLASAATR